MITCKNCSQTFEGAYCPNCAQKARTHRFSLSHLFEEFLHAVTHVDRGILFLMKELSYRPGFVAREYVAGKRKKYFNPFTLFLLVIALQAFAVQKTHIMDRYISELQQRTVSLMRQNEKPDKVSDLESHFVKKMEKTNEQIRAVTENNRVAHMLMIPLLSLLTWVFFRKAGYNYTENLIMNILIMTGTMLYALLIWILPFMIYPRGVMAFTIVNTLFMICFSILAYKQFFGQSWVKTLFKGVILYGIYIGAIAIGSQIVASFF